ncbi:ankyrin repeat domain-containing protein [Thalassobius sp. I31.1]|uniref:ankyrin repeat domain-containing protein n=1 Tax=Thalassobius sp. I31.1 TaxID=2109912 RepID=UPI000D19FD89|nr:ankyrin repeat domain-containing protein [Thalassobius sp. I31.1]
MFRSFCFSFLMMTSGAAACENPTDVLTRNPVPSEERAAYEARVDNCLTFLLSKFPEDRHAFIRDAFLDFAFNGGDVATVRKMMAQDAELTARYELPELTARAADRGHLEMVRFLLTQGAAPDGEPHRLSPLMLAIHQGHTEVVRTLLEAGATRPPDHNLLEEAMRTVDKSHADLVQLLINAGEDPGEPDSDGAPLIHAAAQRGDFRTVQVLLQVGVLVDVLNQQGRTLLETASEHFRSLPAIPALLVGGASRMDEALDRAGLRHAPLTKAYLQAQGNPAAQQAILDQALIEFVQRRRSEAYFLLDAGADPNAFSGEFNIFNALLCAPELGHHLMDHGANPDLARINGEPPGWIEDCLYFDEEIAIDYVRRLGFWED